MTTISTAAYSNADFLTLLAQAGIDPTDATHIANSLPSPVVVETVPPGAVDHTTGQPIPDVTLNGGTALADQPQVLLLKDHDLRVDSSNFARLQYIVLEDTANFNGFALLGTSNVHVYFGDLSGTPTIDGFGVGLLDSGNDTVVGGNANHDQVHGGAGKLQVTLGDGNWDQVFGGTGSEQHFVLGNGTADYVVLGAGAHQTATVGTGSGDLLFGLSTSKKVPTFTYKTIDPPGSITTDALSINDRGQIVGFYYDGKTYHGFLDSGGRYTTIDPPGSTYTTAESINASGQIVGYYQDSSGHQHGFLDSGGRYTTIDPPGSAYTIALSINASGQIVGYYENSSGQLPTHGFLDSGGTYTTIDPPGSTDYSVPESINASGQIVGYYLGGGHIHGFLYSGGTYTTIDPPGSAYTNALGINDSGQIVGYYQDSSSGHIHGFLDSGGTYTTIDPPGSTYTIPLGINASGQIVGFYEDRASHLPAHGFLDSGGTYTTFDAPGSSTETVARSINASGQFVGYYVGGNSSQQQHGFLATHTADTAHTSDQVAQLVQAMAGFGASSGAANSLNTVALSADTSQQSFLTMPHQHT
jgi:probable HAF family extracellular repeat protein